MGMQPFINLKVLISPNFLLLILIATSFIYLITIYKSSLCFTQGDKMFQGYLLGNPGTNFTYESNFLIPYAHGMGLISDELYESLHRNCKGNYNFQTLDPDNVECMFSIISYYKTDGYLLYGYWLNNKSVRKAIHVQKGRPKRCNHGLNYTNDIGSTVVYHKNLSSKGYTGASSVSELKPFDLFTQLLCQNSGDHDMVVSFLGTQAWIRSLNYSIVDDWRPWMVEGQVAGYTRAYANKMTFATVKGAGRTAPEYKPKECYSMFERWIAGQDL